MWTKRHVDVNGLDVHVARCGEGEGGPEVPPLLLVTGIGANLEMWKPFTTGLSGRELIAFDAPGTGRSARTHLPMAMHGLADHVTRLLDVLDVERVDALGYSFGGGLVMELARRAPERLRRLVLCATTPGVGGVPPRPLAGMLLATPGRYYHPMIFRMVLPRIAGGRTARDPVALRAQEEARLAQPPTPLGYAYQLYATAGWTSLPWLHRLPHRTLVVAGDDDPATPLTNARLMCWRMPHARLHIVAGGGHLFLIDQPEEPTAAIQAFLNGR